MSRMVALSLVLAACSGGADAVSDATIVDGPTGDGTAVDAPSTPIDAPAGGTVQCGTMTCGGTTECCITSATERSCVPTGTCGGPVLACDGPSDCGPNQDCCAMFALPFGPFTDGGLPGFDGGLPGFDGGLPGFDGGLPGFDGGLPGFDGGLPGFDGGLPGFDGGLPGFDGGLPGLDGGTSSGGGTSCAPAGSCQLRACASPSDCSGGESCCPVFGGVMACSQFCP